MALLERAAYGILGEFRCGLRRVLEGAEAAARLRGLPPQQHQILLVLAGHVGPEPMSATALAGCLHLKIHTVSEIVGRMADAGLLTKTEHPEDRRRVLLSLSDDGRRHLEALSASHARELDELADLLRTTLDKLSERGVARAAAPERV